MVRARDLVGPYTLVGSTMRSEGCSSVGRAAVSKTVGRGFESCHPCTAHNPDPAQLSRSRQSRALLDPNLDRAVGRE
jgi:hypothetical protein